MIDLDSLNRQSRTDKETSNQKVSADLKFLKPYFLLA